MSLTDRQKEVLAELEKALNNRSSTMGPDGRVVEEPFTKETNILLTKTIRTIPTIDGGLVPPKYDDDPVEGGIGTRHEKQRLHSYLPSGLNSPKEVQTFIVISEAPDSHDTDDIESVRRQTLLSPIFSPGRTNASDPATGTRGFELALFPAKSTGGPGAPLEADDSNGPIPITADPGAKFGAGDEGFWTVDYDNGIVRLSVPPLNGPGGLFNPNEVYGDINGNEVVQTDDSATITMFATYYQYTGDFGTPENVNFVTVGDGYTSSGTFEGTNHNPVQMAVNTLDDLGGGTVFIKEGSYDFTNSVTIPDNVIVTGLGSNTVIDKPESSPAFILLGNNSILRNLKVTSVNSLNDSCVALGSTSDNETIKNVEISEITFDVTADAYGVGFNPSNDNVSYLNITISENEFEASSGETTFIGNVDGYCSIDYLDIYNNNFGTKPASAVKFNDIQVASLTHLDVKDNTSSGNTGIIIDLDNTNVSRLRISNNAMPFADLHLNTSILTASINNNEFGRFDFESYDSVGDIGTTIGSSNIWIRDNTFHLQSDISGHLSEFNLFNNRFLDLSIYGTPWSNQLVSGGKDYNSVAYDGEGTWVAVGDPLAEFALSKDGINWNKYSAMTARSSFSLNAVAHSRDISKLWVAVGENELTLISDDGLEWKPNVLGGSDDLFGVDYANGLWVTVGESGTIKTSTDAITWTDQSSGVAVTLNDISHNETHGWIAVGNATGGNGVILTSPDAITWTQQTTGVSNENLNSVDYNDNLSLWGVVGDNGTILTSSNTTSWTSQTSGTSENLNSIVSDENSNWVTVGETGVILSSSNGTAWSAESSNKSHGIYDIAYGDGRWVFTGEWKDIFTSTDITNWTESDNLGTYDGAFMLDIGYDNKGRWIATSTSGTLLTSDDNANTWYIRANDASSSDLSDQFTSVDYNGEDLWAVVGNNGIISTSPDGLNWTSQTSGTSENLNRVRYDSVNSIWVAVGNASGGDGTILTSSDGVTWNSRTAGVNENLNSVYAGNSSSERLVAVGSSGSIISSTDGTTWNTRASTSSNLQGAAYSEPLDIWAAVGTNGEIQISTDGGINWSAQNSETTEVLYDIDADNSGLFTIITSEGFVLTSSNGTTWVKRNYGLRDSTPTSFAIRHDKVGKWVATSGGNNGGLILTTSDPTDSITHTNVSIKNNLIKILLLLLDDNSNTYSVTGNTFGDFETDGLIIDSNISDNAIRDTGTAGWSDTATKISSFTNCNFDSNVMGFDVVSDGVIRGCNITKNIGNFDGDGGIYDSNISDGYMQTPSFGSEIVSTVFDGNRFAFQPTFVGFVKSSFINNRVLNNFGDTTFSYVEDSNVSDNFVSGNLSISGLVRDSDFYRNATTGTLSVSSSINSDFVHNRATGGLSITSSSGTNIISDRTSSDSNGAELSGAGDGYGLISKGSGIEAGLIGLGGDADGDGVIGIGSGKASGVYGFGGTDSAAGVLGVASNDGYGIWGKGQGIKAGVFGQGGNADGDGVRGVGNGAGRGIYGFNANDESNYPNEDDPNHDAVAILGVADGDFGIGVMGTSMGSGKIATIGVRGVGNSTGILGDSSGIGQGVWGRNDSTGEGVLAQGNGGSATGLRAIGSPGINVQSGGAEITAGVGEGRALELTPNTTHAAVRFIPQIEPENSSVEQGDAYVSADTGKWNVHNGTDWDRYLPQSFALEETESLTGLGTFTDQYTIPGGSLTAGSTVRAMASGRVNFTSSSGSLTIEIEIGGTNNHIARASETISADTTFYMQGVATQRTTGVSGESYSGGMGIISTSARTIRSINTLDTTGDLSVWVRISGFGFTGSVDLEQFVVDVT